jgi:Asp-tRNA(Asn)/Glu-tRNA(Gln) amidotransferase A subunit family amidase
LPALRRAYQDYFARTGVAAIVYPVTMVPATRIGDETDIDIRGRKISLDRALSRNITPSSTAGVPGLVLPAGLTRSGLPVALEFDAPSHADRRLLALGLSLELALGPNTAAECLASFPRITESPGRRVERPTGITIRRFNGFPAIGTAGLEIQVFD